MFPSLNISNESGDLSPLFETKTFRKKFYAENEKQTINRLTLPPYNAIIEKNCNPDKIYGFSTDILPGKCHKCGSARKGIFMIVHKPPMGWNSWNTFGANIDEKMIFEMADTMVQSGLRDAGYEYLVIDDCWSLKKRNEKGELVADPEKFPNGMKAVADYIHQKGLKFGMYSCDGTMTCAQYPGSFDHEFQDAKTFAEWGVDLLKYDNCYRPVNFPGRLLYKRMGLALANCGRDILFSACNWGNESSEKWIKETGAHMWRSTGDVLDNWNSVRDLAMIQQKLLATNGQGCFNDMDMLVVGMHGEGNVGLGGCTEEEYRTHFSLWAFFGSPLMIGCDIRKMSEGTKKILMNKEILAIDQDAAYRQPFPVDNNCSDDFSQSVWVRFLENGDVALGCFNFSDDKVYTGLSLADIGLGGSSKKALKITDLWTGEELGMHEDFFMIGSVPPHECRVFRGRVVDLQ